MIWTEFLSGMVWANLGIVFHFTMKAMNAYTRVGFTWRGFINRIWVQYFASFVAAATLIALVARGVDIGGSGPVFSLFCGYGGASFLKNLLRKYEDPKNEDSN